ncbi:MAG: pyrroline-5-carboxylate reductase [Alphaproteobacteria bacterium]
MLASLLLVGCGKMGGALLRGWIERGVAQGHIDIIEPDPGAADAFASEGGAGFHTSLETAGIDTSPGAIVFAVKPQIMDEVLPPYRNFVGPDTVFLSIAAGRTLASFERHLGAEAAIVRSMPNLPASVGRGMSVACANPRVSADQRRACDEMLEAVGEVAWVDDEALLDPVTAVSGSGPAYVFLLVECLAEAAEEQGLAPELAQLLARTTVIGGGELMRRAPESAARLRENVTSKGGTTAAALDVLMAEDGLARLMRRAVRAATARSRELAG